MAMALPEGSEGRSIAGTSSQISENSKKGTTSEMLGGCSVCLDDQGTEENSLVYCDGCEVAVHQACYGIVDVPPGNWFCRKCEFRDSESKIKCELCPSKDGALKKTETGLWAHVVCALYIPEVRFSNNNTMEPIEIKHIQADRYNKNCYICEESGNSSKASYGAVMDCHKLNCKQSFHVTCAQASGLLCEEAGQGSDNVIYCGYCKHHFRKLKAGNRKTSNSLNKSRSSYLDSASDSSQDNDSRCNTTTEIDKTLNRNNKLPNLPTNLSISDSLLTNSYSTTQSASVPVKATLPSKNALISVTIPLNSASSISTTTTITTPQKKKRNSKNVQAPTISSNSNSSTILATTGALSNSTVITQPQSTVTQPTPTAIKCSETKDPNDVYDWSEKNQNDRAISNNKSSKRKQPSSDSTQASSLKLETLQQSLSIPNYNLQKVSYPNLSLSTSPSLASPSNSTKSTSNSSTSSISTTTATSSSSSSTSSNSPSPALLSPNISSKSSTTRLESPLASKTSTNSLNKSIQESVMSNIALPTVPSNLHTRINLDDLKLDLKKNSFSGSSLLSTTVPIPIDSSRDYTTASSSTNYTKTDEIHSSFHPTSSHASNTKIASTKVPPNRASANTTGSSTSLNTQPTVPPLIIPVPQAPTNSSTKPTAKSSVKSSRKKSTDNSNSAVPKPETKSKPSRSKKAAPASNGSSEVKTTKPESKKGKSKATSKSVEQDSTSTVINNNNNNNNNNIKDMAPKPQETSNPSKRKSTRSASNESSDTSSPAKKPRKKKTVPPSSTTESNSLKKSKNLTSISLPQSSANIPSVNTGPLMINTPAMSNRLVLGMNSLDSNDINNRYFSPMISPYTGNDQLTAPSLSRSSLSRLFTPTSGDTNHCNTQNDPSKAFEELREGTWSNLSKYVLDQAQQFDIPSLIGTLYTLRSENEKLVNKVRDLTMKRDQLLAVSARLDLPGLMLTQHLNNTSPNFSSVVSGLTISPKNIPAHSPGSAINKQPLPPVGSFNHLPSESYLDTNSPLMSQPHSGLNSIKPSLVSTPSPPVGALMAHSNSSRPGLIAVNQPYMSSNVFQPMTQIGPNPSQGSSYYTRQ